VLYFSLSSFPDVELYTSFRGAASVCAKDSIASAHHSREYQQNTKAPTDSFDTMDSDNSAASAQDMLKYRYAPDFNNPFNTISKLNEPTDPMLNDQHMNLFNLSTCFWSDTAQFGALETINPCLSSLDGIRNCDTGYVSREGSNRSLSLDINTGNKQRLSTAKPHKRFSTKSTSTKSLANTRPTRTARRTSKASSVASLKAEAEVDDDKREEFLARNRQAASKCRQKKKEWTKHDFGNHS
jgi:hypothetical protein